MLDSPNERKSLVVPNSWLKKIDYISHLIVSNQTFVAIMGESGSGKSTFIKILQENLDGKTRTQVYNAGDFDIGKVLETLEVVKDNNSHVLIIIDDAQLLTQKALQEVMTITEQAKKPCLHIGFVTDYSLATAIAQLESPLLHTLELGFLTEGETKTYLLQNFPNQNQIYKTLNDKALEQFYLLTGGNISRINQQMANHFGSSIIKTHKKSKSDYKILSLTLVAAVAILGFFLFYESEPPVLNVAVEEHLPEPLIIDSITEPVLLSELPNIEKELMRGISSIPSWSEGTTRLPIQPSPKRILDVSLDDNSNDSLVVRDRVLVIPKVFSAKKNPDLVKKKVAQRLGRSNVIKKSYTIQLLASQKQADIKRFLATHSLKGNIKIRMTTRQGKKWYVLTYGEYRKKEQAKLAMGKLPSHLVGLKPWVRDMTGLRANV